MQEISKYPEIEICDYHNLKRGKDIQLSDGYILKMKINKTCRTFCFLCFCSDTRYFESIIPIIKNVDVVLYHEATFYMI